MTRPYRARMVFLETSLAESKPTSGRLRRTGRLPEVGIARAGVLGIARKRVR